MMTSSNGNIFRVTGHLCGEFTGPGEFPTQRPVTRSFDIFFDRRLNERLSKQPRGWWLETLSCSLWRHRNGILSRVISHPCLTTVGITGNEPSISLSSSFICLKFDTTKSKFLLKSTQRVFLWSVLPDDSSQLCYENYHFVIGYNYITLKSVYR